MDSKYSVVKKDEAGNGKAVDAKDKEDVSDHFTMSTTDSQEEPKTKPERDTWNNKIDFLLACIGFSVGLGNVWRFPYLCYKNGGGAFLLPYFICVLIGGIPMFYLEVALGQFMSEGGIMAWNICPLLQGIGFATTLIVFLLNIYYNVILTWAFYYLFASFTSVLPWSTCGNEWNTPDCRTNFNNEPSNQTSGNQTLMLTNVTLVVGNSTNASIAYLQNATSEVLNKTKGTDSVTEYWERKVLHISSGVDEMGTIKWDLALCLLLAWIVIYFCIWKGIKTSGKVMYFTATSPYILMTVLLIRGCTLDGAIDGIKFYLTPNFEKLGEAQVWVDAGTQIFFSYSISLGVLTALGSYNKFHHNSWKDCIIFAGTNSGTSFFAGFVIFSVLGFKAQKMGVSVSEVAESGPGLAFIAYPEAVSQMPVAPLWSCLFFFMVILLGLDSQFVGVEGFVTAIVDYYPKYLAKGRRREIFIAITCVISFFIGLCMVSYGGMYVFQIFDFYSGSRIILVVAFLECIAVGYIYGVDRFYDNIEMMYGFRIPILMKYMWLIVTPLFTVVLFGLNAYTYSELTYNRTYHYPAWAIGLGWMMACSSIILVPITVIVLISRRPEKTLIERIRYLIKPKLRQHQLRQQDNDPDELIEDTVDETVMNGVDESGFGSATTNNPPSYMSSQQGQFTHTDETKI